MVEITRAGDGVFVLRTALHVTRPAADIFPFFADAANLERITPPWLRFRIVSPLPIAMAEGALIDYRLRVHGVPVSWRTRIAVWEPPGRFVDEQVRGPYRLWRHEHTFREDARGTWCADEVRYRPLGGRLANAAVVRRDLERIFGYRGEQLAAILAA